ncbi:MAG: LLM class F420-dependent oxidoreductase [Chloroflexi bacterium]|nr:LLM class F420-dependent oxidoreductase [Chloroflexota bacterium]
MKRWGLTFPLDGVPLSAHRELLREAETLGYTDAWTMEVDGLDSFTPAALAATWTDEMRIGTAIANVFTRGPALLAQSAAAVAEVAGGRFCLGIGSSSPAIVENWNGVPLQRPYTRMRETVAFLKSVFAGEKAPSEYLGVRGFRIGRRFAEPPPIFIAALQERMLRLAGSEGDGVIINWLTADDVPKVVAVAKDAARAAGRDADALEVVCRIMVLPTENEEVARFVARRAIAGYLTTPVYGGFHEWLGRGEALRPMQEAWDAGDRKAATELAPEDLIDGIFVTGNTQSCLDQIEAYCRNGVTLPVLNLMSVEPDADARVKRTLAAVKELARP